ncbi:MAG: tetratricopeptide repeat protein [Raineya sp.]|jgi:serine phosphatase RsbU (regulator of sigma subunit)/tetratricopeptide (TPR) repeat protein|nr:tetratricopeptide repeat protein [Raineya sp.]
MKTICGIIVGTMLMTCAYGQNINALITDLNKAKAPAEKINLMEKLGIAYQKQNAHKKAIEYFEQAYQLQIQNKEKNNNKIAILDAMGNSQLALKDFPKAIKTYDNILKLQKQGNQKREEVITLHKLAEICETNNQNKEALAYTLECLQINKDLGDLMAVADTHNNLGFLYRQLGDSKKSVDHFMEALATYGRLSRERPNEQLTMFTNLGVTYSYIGKFDDAQEYYQKALKMAEKQGNQREIANLSNYIAANYFVSGKNRQAITQAERAMSVAQKISDDEHLTTSYNILAQIYQKEKDFAMYQKYNKLYQEVKEKVRQKEIAQQQKILEEQINVEKKENELKQDIAKQEKSEAEIRQAILEKQKAEKELENSRIKILNQESEKKRAEQALVITQQQNEADKQRQANEILQRDAELKELKIKDQETAKKIQDQQLKAEKENAKKEKEKANALQEKSDALQKKAEADAKIQMLSFAFAGLAAIAVGYMFFSLSRMRKQKQAIEKQSAEIKTQSGELLEQSNQIAAQNEELRQNQEEIMAQRDAIEQKNNTLNEQNEKISNSINAAMTIQQSVLPHHDKITQLIGEYFLIFRPRDVVSGDFYWAEQTHDGKVVVAAVDCTGHGVPGAFMSIIGSNMLSKVVQLYKANTPAEILMKLDQEIRTVLQQDKTDNQYGMDVSVCVLEKLNEENVKVVYSGAKRPLYYIESGDNQVFTLKGDRRSIGGTQNENVQFTNQEVYLKRGSLLYLGSDGFTDQNNAERVKLGESKFKYLISQNYQMSMVEQKKELEAFLDSYQRGTIQRDDILLMGIKV